MSTQYLQNTACIANSYYNIFVKNSITQKLHIILKTCIESPFEVGFMNILSKD